MLEQLRKYDARATFFCIGDNVAKHPEIASQILTEGHTIGNHTFHHKNGWKTSFEDYLKDIDRCQKQIENLKIKYKNVIMTSEGSRKSQKIKNKKSSPDSYRDNNLKSKILFRPPYGKMTLKQAKAVLKNGHKIIMWDVLSGDYDQQISEEKCLHNVIKNIQQGSIIVFHDSLKAEENLKYALPRVLEYIKEKGWKCEFIS